MKFIKIYSLTKISSQISDKPIPNTEWVRARLCKLQKGCTRLAANIAEILLKVALKHKKSNQKLITLIITF
jgi:hypothetical protein